MRPKTTLATQWVERRGVPCAWLSLDSHDSDPRSASVRYLVAAVEGASAHRLPETAALLAARQAPPFDFLVASDHGVGRLRGVWAVRRPPPGASPAETLLYNQAHEVAGMNVVAGTRLGPYEVRGPIGAGGMGAVYRAWDPRFDREVAVKVLLPSATSDPDGLRRFEQEAKAAGALNHQNVLAVYDVGQHEGSPYLVSELLRGETLRERLRKGSLAPRKAIEYAIQIAQGLAAAHEVGVVHRDVKPENVLVTRTGVVKVIDFGVAKLREPPAAGDDEAAPNGHGLDSAPVSFTRPGVILGTAAYMSPEQVLGRRVDARSDIFALGAVLYEMLAGRRPFAGETLAELATAILYEEPPRLTANDPRIAPALDGIVRRCLEKRPQDRFDTARDLALSLELVAAATGESPVAAAPGRRLARRGGAWTLAAAVVAGIAIGAAVVAVLDPPSPPPSYSQLTFRRGTILSGRFGPDGQVLYSAAWDGQPARIFATRAGSREALDVGIEGTVQAISPTGEMAVILGRFQRAAQRGTLARLSALGGLPREVLEDVREAQWDPSGRRLVVLRDLDGRTRLEYPIGHVLYEPPGQAHSLLVLPAGGVALLERLPDGSADPCVVSHIDPDGTRAVLSRGWADCYGLGWSSARGEILLAGSTGGEYALHALSLSGRARLVTSIPGDIRMHDVDRTGRVLVARSSARTAVEVLPPGATQERDMSWLDFSSTADISEDGRLLLLSEIGGGLAGRGGVYLRRTDGSPAVMLGAGGALALSPDARFVLALPDTRGSGDRLLLIPRGAGEQRELKHHSIERFVDGAWFPDGHRIAVVGGQDEARARLFGWDVNNVSVPRPLSPEGVQGSPVVAPDGRWVAVHRRGAPLALYSSEGESVRPLTDSPDDWPLRWSRDGRFLYVRRGWGMPARIDRVEVATGARRLWRELHPSESTGYFGIGTVDITPDGKSHAYTAMFSLDTLYLAEGIR